MVNTILFVLLFLDFDADSIYAHHFSQSILNLKEIQGTWKTASPNGFYDPVFTIILDNRELFIYKFKPGSGGYKQLLSYKTEGNTIIAKEKEIIFFDQTAGNIIAHYKHRPNTIQLTWNKDTTPPTLVLEPAQPGSVLIKDSDLTAINFKWKEEFSRLKKCPYFKSDD